MSISDAPMWLVRSGRGGIYTEHFLQAGEVAIGWGEVGEIPPDLSDSEISHRFSEVWPNEKPKTRETWAAQVKRFLRTVEVDDQVATYDPGTRAYHLGSILSPANRRVRNIDNQERIEFVREVVWNSSCARDGLSLSARNSLGSSLTLFRVPKTASVEMLGSLSDTDLTQPTAEDATGDSEPLFPEDVLQEYFSRSEQLIEDKIASLDWQELQELVAGIIRSMGFRTRVSMAGPDRGVDVFASPDGLGLGEPRIFVEVKHRAERVNSQMIRAFLGGRQQGDRCLYVSTGGFTTDARYEADRSSIPLTLITLVELRELLIDYYETLDPVTRSLVPLRKLFLPASE